MKTHSFRIVAFTWILLASLAASAIAQAPARGASPRRIGPPVGTSVLPTTPKPPTIVTPAKPVFVHPGKVVPQVPYVTTPPYYSHGYSYPSGWVGPTIIRETYTESAPSAYPPPAAPAPAHTPGFRLVAVLGMLQHLDPGTGADIGLAEERLGISLGMLVGHEQRSTVRASGDFFGVPWDGPGSFTQAEDSKSGPFLDHPIMTLNESSPGPWEFEAGTAGQRVGWVRLAVALFEDQSRDPNAPPLNLPRGRRAAMRDVLMRIPWAGKNVAVKSSGTPDAAAFAGGDITYFGKALATFGEKTMTPVPENERIGIAEWFFTAQDLARVIATCPRFGETPEGAQLRGARAAAGRAIPEWARPCEFRSEGAHYFGELWFVIVPDAAIDAWVKRK